MIIYSLSPQPSITNCKAIEKRSTLKISSLTLKNNLLHIGDNVITISTGSLQFLLDHTNWMIW